MLVLRLLVMVLTIICLMDGHAEVSSSTTGIRDRRESPAVKTNEPEVQIHDRKKKKKPKPGKKKKPKPGKKKKPNKAKPTPTKPVTTTPTVSTSTLKTTTILTTPTITTTTPTVSPTTTATTAKTTTSTASATTTISTTTSATTSATKITVATSSTASTTTTTIPTTVTTSSLPTTVATTADSGAGEECKATNGKPCLFPFKDGNEEYNECKNEGGKYFWCATSVYDSGKYKHWSYCSTDGPCPLEGDGECRAANNKPCVFPFKDGGKEYNECADHGGQYFWCATGTNSAGKYTAWSKCPKDGSCPLPQKTTTPMMTPTATAATTTLLTTGTSTTPDEIENKVVSSLKDLVKEESKDGTLEMLEAMHKITETIIDDLKAQSEDNDPKNIESNHTFHGGNPRSEELSLQYKQGVHYQETRLYYPNYEWFPDYVIRRGAYYYVSQASDCCWGCQLVSPDALFFDYDPQFQKCYCLAKRSSREPAIWKHNIYTAGKCGIITCNLPITSPSKDACPPGYKNNIDGFPQEPDSLQVISRVSIDSKEKCKEACDDKQESCLGFYFNTCDKKNEPNRCLLLNVDSVDVTSEKNNNIFCKREPQGIFTECQCPDKGYPCDRCLITGYCQNPEFDCKEEICYVEKKQNRDGYIPCGLSVAIKAFEFCRHYKLQTRMPQEQKRSRSVTATVQKNKKGKKEGTSFKQGKSATVNYEDGKEPKPKEELEIYTIPMGQGDGTIIRCPGSNELTIIDMGGKGGRGLNREQYFSIIKNGNIKNIFLTHPDEDHLNYFDQIMTEYTQIPGRKINIFTAGDLTLLDKKVDGKIKGNDIYTVYEISKQNSPQSCGHYEEIITDENVHRVDNIPFISCKFVKVQPTGEETKLVTNVVNICDGFQVTLMAGNYYFSKLRKNIKNEMSLVLKVTPNDKANPSILITGDFESPGEKKDPSNPLNDFQSLLNEGQETDNVGANEEVPNVNENMPSNENQFAKFHAMLVQASYFYYRRSTKAEETLKSGLQSTVLVVPHHGSYTKGNGIKKFFAYIRPSYAIISADPYYSYGHPRCEVIINLANTLNTRVEASTTKQDGSVPISCLAGMPRYGFDIQYIYIKTSPDRIFQTIRCSAEKPEVGCKKIDKQVEQTHKDIFFIKTIMNQDIIKSVEYTKTIFEQFIIP